MIDGFVIQSEKFETETLTYCGTHCCILGAKGLARDMKVMFALAPFVTNISRFCKHKFIQPYHLSVLVICCLQSLLHSFK